MRRAWLIAMAGLVLGGCGDSPQGPIEPGGFELELSGAMTDALSGEASFLTRAGSGEPLAFHLVLVDDARSGELDLRTRLTWRPAIGVHEITALNDLEDPAAFRGTFSFTIDNFLQICDIRSGSITVTESSPLEVSGTLELRCETRFDTSQGPAGDLFVVGEFTARPFDPQG